MLEMPFVIAVRRHGQRQCRGKSATAAEHGRGDAGDLAVPVSYRSLISIGAQPGIVRSLPPGLLAKLGIEGDKHAPACSLAQRQQVTHARMVPHRMR